MEDFTPVTNGVISSSRLFYMYDFTPVTNGVISPSRWYIYIYIYALRRGQFWKILKTLVQLILNSTWPHVITYTNTLTTSCCCWGKPLDCESLVFNRQSDVVSVTISCVGGDSFKWLSFPIKEGSSPKYYVNLRWALFYFLLEIYWIFLSRYFKVFFFL